MLSERAFRAQLVTQGQRELYDYWHLTAGSRRMPARSDINPFSVPKLLPCIGLIDLTEGLGEARFRLAGTRLRDVYGEEITGKRIDRVFAGACADYWQRHPRPGGGAGFAAARRGPRTVARARPYRVVLAAVTVVAGWNQGRQDPLLRHGGPYRGCSRAGRTPPSPLSGAAAADVDRAAAGAVRLGRSFARRISPSSAL